LELGPIVAWPPSTDGLLSDSQLSGDLSGQSIDDIVMERCRVTNAQFTGTALNALRLTDVVIENSDLSGADFDESTFTRVVFRDCRGSGAVLTRCDFRDVLVSSCRFDGANFRMSAAKTSLFEGVDLRDCDFYGTSLDETRFFDCDLTGAQFSKAKMVGVRFHGSTLQDLKGSESLAGAVIESAQVLPIALGVLDAFGITVNDDRDFTE
jgi:uncharacterized protein YjbI with pentapeptide repeats